MATTTITALTNYTSPDRTADVLPIVNVSGNQTQKITINSLLSITGAPIGTTDSQTLSNKTINNTNAITVKDGSFSIQNTADTSKVAIISASAVPPSTTATYVLPTMFGADTTETLVTTAASQTLTNKIISSATIGSPTISNATISSDSYSGFTSANNGSIFGISVTNSQIGPTALSSGAIKLGFAQITSNFTLSASQTTPTQVTGLSVTVTVPSGGRTIQITAYCGALQPAAGTALWGIWDGVVNSGTQIGQANTVASVAAVTAMAVVTPGAGSKTYNVGVWNTGSNNVTVGATSVVQPAFILVEAI